MSREMKDSGVEWLGEIPKGWNVKKGKALYSITTGKLDANAEEPTGIYPLNSTHSVSSGSFASSRTRLCRYSTDRIAITSPLFYFII